MSSCFSSCFFGRFSLGRFSFGRFSFGRFAAFFVTAVYKMSVGDGIWVFREHGAAAVVGLGVVAEQVRVLHRDRVSFPTPLLHDIVVHFRGIIRHYYIW